MALAPFFAGQQQLQVRIRSICFAFPTPLYFLNAGSFNRSARADRRDRVFGLFPAITMATKFVGILPSTRYFKFEPREALYHNVDDVDGFDLRVNLSMLDLANHRIDHVQYTVLLTAVMGSAIVSTLVAQIWCQPRFEPLAEDAQLILLGGRKLADTPRPVESPVR